MEYAEYVQKISPKSKLVASCIWAFIIGGLICLMGEGFIYLYKHLLPQYDTAVPGALSSCSLIILASLLTGFGVFDKLGKFAGAGTIVPITGFSNSITSSAMEFRKEGLIFGTCANMFKIAGPVIVVGAAISMFFGVIYWLVGLF